MNPETLDVEERLPVLRGRTLDCERLPVDNIRVVELLVGNGAELGVEYVVIAPLVTPEEVTPVLSGTDKDEEFTLPEDPVPVGQLVEVELLNGYGTLVEEDDDTEEPTPVPEEDTPVVRESEKNPVPNKEVTLPVMVAVPFGRVQVVEFAKVYKPLEVDELEKELIKCGIVCEDNGTEDTPVPVGLWLVNVPMAEDVVLVAPADVEFWYGAVETIEEVVRPRDGIDTDAAEVKLIMLEWVEVALGYRADELERDFAILEEAPDDRPDVIGSTIDLVIV